MWSTLTILITAHLLGDFVLQTRWLVDRKERPAPFLLHIALVTLVAGSLLGDAHVVILAATFTSHALIDAVKLRAERAPWGSAIGRFAIDQSLHLGVATVLAVTYPAAADDGWWMTRLTTEGAHWYLAGLTLASGTILCVSVGGIVISMLTRPLLAQVNADTSADDKDASQPEAHDDDDTETHRNDLEGLKQGGRYIGWLERALVLLLILMNQPGGVGFIVAAKSVLRFGEVRNARQRRIAEYVIIGTFLSFGWGLLVAALTRQALLYWLS